jgi:demethoxyubiquinone hydroxylase (CLK1/Coq7/Cat5 family)
VAKDKTSQPFKDHASHDRNQSNYILKVNNLGKVVAKYVYEKNPGVHLNNKFGFLS